MLTVRDHMRVRLAAEARGQWFQRAGRIRFELGESETLFAAAVDRLIDDAEVVAAYPVETARLRRLRSARKAARQVCTRAHIDADTSP